jgi:Asp/Glu/hydantoin racemase
MTIELLVVNPNTTASITELVAVEAGSAAGPSTHITAVNPTWGTPSIETHVDTHLAALAVLDLLDTVGPRDGVLVAAFSDPGLGAVQEAVDVPVVGMGAAALHAAAACGPFVLLTVQPASVALIEPMLRIHDTVAQCRAVHALDASVIDAATGTDVQDRLVEAARRLVRETGAECICLAGGPLGRFAAPLASALQIEVVTGVAAGVRELEARIARQPRGHRAPAYRSMQRKHFTGSAPFLPALDHLLWEP